MGVDGVDGNSIEGIEFVYLAEERSGARMSRDNNSELLNSIFKGEVASVHSYGAFVRIPGNKNQGLVHRTQVSKVAVDDVSEVLQRGEKVWCKVISITDDNKIALSMKVVNQGNGKDLDPNGVQIHQDEQRRKIHIPGSGKKTIQLEAVFNTTCSKCGTRGHLARDCFKSPDGKTYELIPEEEPDIQNQSTKVSTVQEKDIKAKKQRKKKKKHKKEKGNRKVKKNKKQRKRRQKTSSSHSEEPSSGNSDEEQQNKESCHRRKRKHSVSPSSEHRKRLRH
ncbi:Nucleolar protein of 40 kDa [Cryptotermes secundus]|uniref:Nucleolar protein of 40 kDa n=1 Tax=Cryptotermes secundus TaxID=105785 RepID=A0A2J7PEU9_9NEOP|nr:nucleolar protein of 40 kDa isoform X1 [Cryptotermes secundus]PNF14859.1 Nucleolar protein of 40 kDa [Cryptotermes secundus]